MRQAEGGFEEDGLDINSRPPLSPGGGIRGDVGDEGRLEDTGSFEHAVLERVGNKDQESLAFFQVTNTKFTIYRNRENLGAQLARSSLLSDGVRKCEAAFQVNGEIDAVSNKGQTPNPKMYSQFLCFNVLAVQTTYVCKCPVAVKVRFYEYAHMA